MSALCSIQLILDWYSEILCWKHPPVCLTQEAMAKMRILQNKATIAKLPDSIAMKIYKTIT